MKQALGLALVASLLGGCNTRAPQKMDSAPVDFTLRDTKGKTVKLSDFRGHPVLLDFWATWCGPCRLSMPMVQEFYARHAKDGLVVLGLNMDEDPEYVPKFIQHFKITYPILLASDSMVPVNFGMEGIPLFIFIDKKGRPVERFDGFASEMIDAWERTFEQLAADPA